NVKQGHQLTLRTNYITSLANIGFPSTTTYVMPGNYYQFTDKTSSTVGQLNSTFKSSVNELRVNYQHVRDDRGDQTGQKPFPFIQVDSTDGTNLRFGSESPSHANAITEDITELTDDFTMIRGRHT